MKIKSIVVALSMVVSSQVFGGDLIVDNPDWKVVEAPHFWEFDPSENIGYPNNYWWCGQTAFKIALEAQGIYKTLEEIHEDFKVANKGLGIYYENNCPGKWCAAPKLMEKAITAYRNSGENIYYQRKTVYSASDLLATVKSAVKSGDTVVALSNKVYNHTYNRWSTIGHFMTLHGYYDGNYQGQLHQTIYVRDPYKVTDNGWISDKAFDLNELYANMKDGSKVVLGIISSN
jgi:hypothetical protein